MPQIYAETIEDLFRAQGFVHAQDRFWEMDLRQHVTSGRLAELFGTDQVERDAFLRTLGWRRVAEQEWAMVTADTRQHLTAYAEGMDAWVEATGGPAATGRKALQYRVLGLQHSGYEVAPWEPVDTVIVPQGAVVDGAFDPTVVPAAGVPVEALVQAGELVQAVAATGPDH